ncbi:MAG: hypothetical protein IPM46_07285 [Flavobacteriales bacterium]|nr:hypothetical protein [Flavobacteriales bacterium]
MRTLLASYALVVTLLLGIVVGVHYSQRNPLSSEALKETDQVDQWGSWSDVFMVVFSGLLLSATVVQIVLWRRANQTAEDALTIARKDLESSHRVERGKVVLERAYISDEGGSDCYVCIFRNIGRSSVVVRTVGLLFNRAEGVMPQAGTMNDFLMKIPMERAVAYNETVEITTRIPLLTDIYDEDRNRSGIYVRCQVIFTTLNKVWRYHCCWFSMAGMDEAVKPAIAGQEFEQDITGIEVFALLYPDGEKER